MAYPDWTTNFELSQGEKWDLPALTFVLPPDFIVFQLSDETNFSALWVYVFFSILDQVMAEVFTYK